jgi:hypothetical protein
VTVFHGVGYFFLCILPIYHLVNSVLGPVSVYCQIWNC